MTEELERIEQLIQRSKTNTSFLEVLKAQEELRLLREATHVDGAKIQQKELLLQAKTSHYQAMAAVSDMPVHI